MTDIAEIADRHAWIHEFPGTEPYCEHCAQPWPCDTAQVLKELERAQRPFEIIERMRGQGWHVDIVSMNGVNAPTTWKVTFSSGCSHIGCPCHKSRSGYSTDLSAAISRAAEEATP